MEQGTMTREEVKDIILKDIKERIDEFMKTNAIELDIPVSDDFAEVVEQPITLPGASKINYPHNVILRLDRSKNPHHNERLEVKLVKQRTTTKPMTIIFGKEGER